MKLKPIEPGCKAVIINTSNSKFRKDIGKVVTVERIFAPFELFYYRQEHLFNSEDPGALVSGDIVSAEGVVGEAFVNLKHLMRIDGDDFSREDNPYALKNKDRYHA